MATERGLVVDIFAGGGGASLGLEMAGIEVDIAINHDPEAIAMHAANHPRTTHYVKDVWEVRPRDACKGRPVHILWASPNCTHFSRARGGKPMDRGNRALSWSIVRWARDVRPEVILCENVNEWVKWGPLDDEGRPIPERQGDSFRRWVAELRRLGYAVEWRRLRAMDRGVPTTRERTYLVARCDGQPIRFPSPSHGAPGNVLGLAPYATAAECIDWSIPCPSIFNRAKELADATKRRIARGVMRHVVNAAAPFVVNNMAHNVPRSVHEPLAPVLTGNHKLLVSPIVAPLTHQGERPGQRADEPFPVVTAAHRGELALIAPTLVQTSYGERPGQTPRALDLQTPLGVTPAGGQKHGLVAAFLARNYGGPNGNPNAGGSVRDPFATTTTQDHHALVTATLGEDRSEQVRAFLIAYYGTDQDARLDKPLPTATTRDRFGLVTVHGHDYYIRDIGMRLLVPRELARANGFPDDYILDPAYQGRPLTKTAQVRMVGNCVCPWMAASMAEANGLGRAPLRQAA